MRTTLRRRLGLTLAAVLAAALPAVAPAPASAQQTHGDRVVLAVGHTDAMSVHYEGGRLGLKVKDDTGDSPVYRDPADVLFQVLPHAEIAIPSGSTWSFLGQAGDPMWLLPLSQDHSLLWPGWSTETLSRGQFQNDRVTMSLTGVDGPGHVVLWTVSNFGQPAVTFNSRDGLPDALPVNVPSHVHSNWAFTAPGAYTLTWKIDGTLADGTAVSTGEVAYRWHVGDLPADPTDPGNPGDIELDGRLILNQGHVDVMSVHRDDKGLDLQTKDDTRLHGGRNIIRDPDDVAFHVDHHHEHQLGDWASEPGFDQIAGPDDTVWWMPDVDQQHKLFAGWSTETIRDGELRDNAIGLDLVGFTGPGDLVMLTLDGFGWAEVEVDTKQPLPQTINTWTNTHAHINWYFTEPGVYGLTWRATGALPDGTAVNSAPRQYVFVVGDWPDGGDPGDPGDPGGPGNPGPAPENAQTITATIDADTGGLVISVNPNDRNVNLPAATLNSTATRWTTTGALRPVTVTDTRSADPGWTASGQVGQFTSANASFSGSHLTWTPNVASRTDGQTVTAGPRVNGTLDGGPGLATSQTLAGAPSGSGRGTAVLGAELRLDLPTNVESGTYTALITFTAI